MTATDAAIKAGYSPRFARENCPKLLQKTTIQERLATLNLRTENACVATVGQRKERLTQFINEDNVTDKGNLSRASNIAAISELNKMEHIYDESHYQDNRVINFIVSKDQVEGIRRRLGEALESKSDSLSEG